MKMKMRTETGIKTYLRRISARPLNRIGQSLVVSVSTKAAHQLPLFLAPTLPISIEQQRLSPSESHILY
jgi:hypothetical protein